MALEQYAYLSEIIAAIVVSASLLGSFTGLPQGHPDYEALVTRVKDTTLGAGLTVGGPLAWMSTRDGYGFFSSSHHDEPHSSCDGRLSAAVKHA